MRSRWSDIASVVFAIGLLSLLASCSKPSPENTVANSASSSYEKGKAAENAGRDKEAVDAYQAALKASPQSFEAMNGLAYIQATSTDAAVRNPQNAVTTAELLVDAALKRFIQRRQNRPAENVTRPFTNLPLPASFFQIQMMNTLAAAYAAAGQFKTDITTRPIQTASGPCHASATDVGGLALDNARAVAAAQPTPAHQQLVASLEKNLKNYRAGKDLTGIREPQFAQ